MMWSEDRESYKKTRIVQAAIHRMKFIPVLCASRVHVPPAARSDSPVSAASVLANADAAGLAFEGQLAFDKERVSSGWHD